MCRGPHCLVWFGQAGTLFIGCAHCHYVKNKIEFTDADLLDRLILGSRDGHSRLCKRNVGAARPPRPPARRPMRRR